MTADGRSSALVLRTANERDAATIVELVQSAYRGEMSRAGWTTEADLVSGQRTDVESVLDDLQRASCVVRLALVGDAVAACCRLEREHGASAYFGLFAVRPQQQACGIGSAVLADAERFAKASWQSIHLRMTVIRQRSELIDWYRRRGYELTGATEPFPYGDERFGIPLRDDLEFVELRKTLA